MLVLRQSKNFSFWLVFRTPICTLFAWGRFQDTAARSGYMFWVKFKCRPIPPGLIQVSSIKRLRVFLLPSELHPSRPFRGYTRYPDPSIKLTRIRLDLVKELGELNFLRKSTRHWPLHQLEPELVDLKFSALIVRRSRLQTPFQLRLCNWIAILNILRHSRVYFVYFIGNYAVSLLLKRIEWTISLPHGI